MRRTSLVFGLVAALLLAVLIRAQWGPAPGRPGPLAPVSGMALLDSYKCRPGETRRVVVRGVEDNFSGLGNEPAGMHPRLRARFYKHLGFQTDYDAKANDHELADWFELPSNTVSAMMVTRLRALGDNLNDSVTVGDMEADASFAAAPADLDARGWKRRGELYWADLAGLRLHTGPGSLLDLVHSAAKTRILDVFISDDTSVDFLGMAWCEAPPGGMGLTMAPTPAWQVPKPMVEFVCRSNYPADKDCNAFVGDRACDRPLPLLCFHDLGQPVPAALRRYNQTLARNWSGGEVAATEPVAGSSFRTIADADRACSAKFGRDWRVADWGLGPAGLFYAAGGAHTFSGRYWIDIRGSRYATCWGRDRGR